MKEILENLSLLAQIISFPIAAIAIYISVRSSKRDRDVNLLISLSETFRDRWENRWRATIQEFEELPVETKPNEKQINELLNILNWIDWLGWLIENKVINKHSIIINSIGPVLSRAINAGKPLINEGTELYGKSFWAGVFVIKELVDGNTNYSRTTNQDSELYNGKSSDNN